MISLYHTKSVTFWNDCPFTRTPSMQGIPVILKSHNLQSLYKVLEFKICEAIFTFWTGAKMYGGYI